MARDYSDVQDAFFDEAHDSVTEAELILLELEKNPEDKELVHRLFRAVHTIKGGAMFFSLAPIVESSHAAENLLDRIRSDNAALDKATIRVLFSCLDFLKGCIQTRMQGFTDATALRSAFQELAQRPAEKNSSAQKLVSDVPQAPPVLEEPSQAVQTSVEQRVAAENPAQLEFVKVKTHILQQVLDQMAELSLLKAQIRSRFPDDPAIQGLTSRLNSLHDTIMKMRMQRLDTEFAKYKRVVRDLAQTLGKKIELRLELGEVEIDRALVEALSDPMVHILRNAADHGIEPSAERAELGKPAIGQVTISARQSGGVASIEIQDDGRGIDTEAVMRRALEKQLDTRENLERMSQAQLLELTLRPGFSTAHAVSSVSGRGVGLDAVKAATERAGGKLSLESTKGRGTRLTLSFPLSLAVASFMKCRVGGKGFLIYRSAIEELVPVPPDLVDKCIVKGDSGLYFNHRDALVPLIDLRTVLGKCEAETPSNSRIVLVCSLDTATIGFMIDSVVRVEELPHKPLPTLFGNNPFFSGATLSSSGLLVAILDLKKIADGAGVLSKEPDRKKARQRILKDSTLNVQESIIVFSNHPTEYFGISSSFVSEVVKNSQNQIETRGDRSYVSVKGRYYLCLHIEAHLNARSKPDSLGSFVLFLLPNRYGTPVALIGNRIVGVDHLVHNEDPNSNTEIGVLEVIPFRNKLVSVLDIDYICHRELPTSVKPRRFDLDKLHVLIADDSSFFRSLLNRYLAEEGMRVTTARDGAEALNILNTMKELPDIILSDLTMPNMGGIGLVEQIRSTRRLKHLPMIAVSTIANAADIEKALSMGFDEYEVKVNRESLLEKIERVLSRKSRPIDQETPEAG